MYHSNVLVKSLEQPKKNVDSMQFWQIITWLHNIHLKSVKYYYSEPNKSMNLAILRSKDHYQNERLKE